MASYLIAIIDERKPPTEGVVEVIHDGSQFTWRNKTPGAFRVRDDETHGGFSGLTRNSPILLAKYKEGSFNCFQLLNFFDTVREDPRGRSRRGEGQIFREGAGILQAGDMTWVLLPFKS